MKKNVGNPDKIVRIILAIVLVALYFTNVITGTWGIVALVAAAIMVATSFMSSCPLYSVFGFSSCPLKSSSD